MSIDPAMESALRQCDLIQDRQLKESLKGCISRLQNDYDQIYNSTLSLLHTLSEGRGKILSASSRFLERLGFTEAEVIGEALELFLENDSRKSFREEVMQICLKDGETKQVPLKLVRKDGSILSVRIQASAKKGRSGLMDNALLILEDLTELKNAELALKEQAVKKRVILDAIQTPLRQCVSKLSQLKSKLKEEDQSELQTVLDSLSEDNLLRPSFTDPKAVLDIDTEVHKWLIHEYSTVATSYAYLPNIVEKREDRDINLGLLNSLNFNAFHYIDRQDELITLFMDMLEHYDLFQLFSLDRDRMVFFLHRLKSEYRNVPYHNFLHAFDVTQLTFYLLTTGGMDAYLSDLDILSVLLSAIGHDVCHPGLNNNFQEQTSSPLALTYNDQSVLENQHLSSMFQIIHDSSCQLFDVLPEEIRRELRKSIISNILSTDMKKHFEILTLFSNRLKKSLTFDRYNSDDRMLLMRIMLKCADVCNAARPFRISKKWAEVVMEEFFHQGDLERSAQLPISTFMDRNSTSIPKCQMAFIEFIAKPLYGSLVLGFPGLQECIRNIEENSMQWKRQEGS